MVINTKLIQGLAQRRLNKDVHKVCRFGQK